MKKKDGEWSDGIGTQRGGSREWVKKFRKEEAVNPCFLELDRPRELKGQHVAPSNCWVIGESADLLKILQRFSNYKTFFLCWIWQTILITYMAFSRNFYNMQFLFIDLRKLLCVCVFSQWCHYKQSVHSNKSIEVMASLLQLCDLS